MFSFLSKSNCLYSIEEQDNYLRDNNPLELIHNYINWNKSVVGGSFALSSFKPDFWKPSDIDIMVLCNSTKEFNDECNKFKENVKCELLKENWAFQRVEYDNNAELFHAAN